MHPSGVHRYPPGQHRGGPPVRPQHSAHVSKNGTNRHGFDVTQAESAGFQRVYPVADDKVLTEALLQRNEQCTPSSHDQAYVSALLTKIYSQLETLVLNPAAFEPAQIEEIKQVGSYKTQTMVAGRNAADLVIVLRTLPTKEAVTALVNKLIADYRVANRNEFVTSNMTPYGFEISTRQAVLCCLIATVPTNLRLLDDNIHIPARQLIERHLAAIRHVKWFDENANNATVRALIRIVRDLTRRFTGLSSLNSWMITLLAHHAINSSRSANEAPLALAPAFKRCLQLLAGGIFLPGAAGIVDPCQTLLASTTAGSASSVHETLTFEQMDQICFTAQTLLRVNSHGGCRHVLGLEGDASIAVDMSIFSNIVVTASEAAYDRSEIERWEQEDAAAFTMGEGGELADEQEGEEAEDVVMEDTEQVGNKGPDVPAVEGNKEDLEQQVEQFMAMISEQPKPIKTEHDVHYTGGYA